jgi:uncharacterized protein (DUF2252 family)
MKTSRDDICKPEDREAVLTERRRLKMAFSAHSYVRGSTLKFYEWLGSTAARSLPQGPPVWICGDCHLGNLGPVADAKGRVKIAIRDLDQTVIGNPAHDLIRLGLSLATAIRGSDLPGVTTALMLEQMVKGYESALVNPGKNPRKSAAPVSVKRVLKRALKRRWRHLAEERIEDVRPEIPMGKRFWPVTAAERKEIHRIFKLEEVRDLITSLKDRDKDDEVEVVDAAYWMKGCSSLGRLRFAVLLGIGKKKKKSEGFCLVDIKEAVPPGAPHSAKAPMPRDYAKRVVEGARKLSPFLGQRILAGHFSGKPAVLRELLPQDLKLEMDQLTREEAIDAARFLASVVGAAHAQQMDRDAREKWQMILKQNRSKRLDAPSWFWTSVVELVARHESAYLDHCRQYALYAAQRR